MREYTVTIGGEIYSINYAASLVIDRLEAENAKLIAQRDSFRKTASGMSDLLRAVAAIAGTEEYDDDFSVTIKALESMRADEKLDKPARVNATVFREGVSKRLVIEAAQRFYEWRLENPPESDDDFKNKVFDFIDGNKSDEVKILTSERDTLLAEREQWMKQEPVFYATKNLNIVITAETYNCGTAIGQADYPVPLYALPAQQVPEGYTLVPIEPTKEMIDAGSKHVFTYILTTNTASKIYKEMLSAAPKPEDK